MDVSRDFHFEIDSEPAGTTSLAKHKIKPVLECRGVLPAFRFLVITVRQNRPMRETRVLSDVIVTRLTSDEIQEASGGI